MERTERKDVSLMSKVTVILMGVVLLIALCACMGCGNQDNFVSREGETWTLRRIESKPYAQGHTIAREMKDGKPTGAAIVDWYVDGENSGSMPSHITAAFTFYPHWLVKDGLTFKGVTEKLIKPGKIGRVQGRAIVPGYYEVR